MKKSKYLILALALSLLLPAFSGRAGEAQEPLVVASVTKMNGMFSTNMWGNNTADVDMRLLLHGHPLFYEDVGQGEHVINEAVIRELEEREEDGKKIFSITLQPYLVYNTGAPINARDYVFSILLTNSSYISDIGGSPVVMHFLEGAEEYDHQPTIPFTGVRLIDFNTFELVLNEEVSKEDKVYQYINITPYPISVIAPGCTVQDDGNGAYVAGPWTAELLRTTMLDPVNGYLSHPRMTSGPYSLVSYDYESGVAEVTINRNFFGNPYSVKPTIPRIRFEHILQKDILPKLRSGEVDIVNKVVGKSIADAALEDGILHSVDYSREGVAYLTFAMERPLPSLMGVRQAIANSLNVDELISNYLGERGTRVFGFYGSNIAKANEWRSQVNQLIRHEYDLEKAVEALESEGFVYDEKGNLYNPAIGGIRYRVFDPAKQAAAPQGDAAIIEPAVYESIANIPAEVAKLLPLSITIGISPENEVAQILVNQLEQSLPRVGAQLNVEMLDMPVLLQHYYQQVPRTADLYFLGSNFMKDFTGNPSGYAPESFDQGNNPAGFIDPVLADLTTKLRESYTTSTIRYKRYWVEYQQRLGTLLPIIPLYTNTYTDIYTEASRLTEYRPDEHWSWAEAIVYARLQ